MTITKSDQKLISDLQKLLDQADQLRRGLTSKGFAPRANGCVCEGTALCAHHAAVYNLLDDAAIKLSLAIGEAQREE